MSAHDAGLRERAVVVAQMLRGINGTHACGGPVLCWTCEAAQLLDALAASPRLRVPPSACKEITRIVDAALVAPAPTSMGISQSPETIADLAATYDDQPVPAWTGVHLCCGLLRFPGWVNVDVVDLGQDVVADLAKPWTFLQPGSVDRMYCKDGFEHQTDLTHFLREAARALKPGGTLEIWVPHYKNPSAYRLTHHHFFSWSCFHIYPEPHDEVQDLKVQSVRLYLGWSTSAMWKPIHALVNLAPKWWERIGYVSNIRVIFEKVGV